MRPPHFFSFIIPLHNSTTDHTYSTHSYRIKRAARLSYIHSYPNKCAVSRSVAVRTLRAISTPWPLPTTFGQSLDFGVVTGQVETSGTFQQPQLAPTRGYLDLLQDTSLLPGSFYDDSFASGLDLAPLSHAANTVSGSLKPRQQRLICWVLRCTDYKIEIGRHLRHSGLPGMMYFLALLLLLPSPRRLETPLRPLGSSARTTQTRLGRLKPTLFRHGLPIITRTDRALTFHAY